ncbi:MAG: AAA family ATPase, partial [Oscillospiraceae bacterium]|nr:AAA family ATPase [Oscillospiraceae bacterium]
GYDEGGQLTEAVRRRPYCVVLFDEIEKAHPDVFNVLLQVLDDGRITDSQGRTVDFKNTILIMTSNLGSDILLQGIENGEITEAARAEMNALLRRSFRPEFLNRIDETVCYKPLSESEIALIAELQLKGLRERLAARQLSLAVDDSAKALILREGYDPVYGARPLRRYLQSAVETAIARCILRDDPAAGSAVTVSAEGDGIVARVQ